MKKIRQVLSMVLAFVMCFSAIPVHAATTGSITVTTKNSSFESIAGASYQFENLNAGNYQNCGIYEDTDNDGEVSFAVSSSGWYRVTQLNVQDEYTLDAVPQTVFVDLTKSTEYPVLFQNKTAQILEINRIDPITRDALEGAVFEVRDNYNAVVFTGTTDVDGKTTFSNIPAGDYVVTEITAPDGYVNFSSSQPITISASSTGTNRLYFYGASSNSITIINTDLNTGAVIENSSFKITSLADASVVTVTTGIDGVAYAGDLDPGTYIIAQTSVGNGYSNILSNHTVTLSNGTSYVWEVSDVTPATVTVSVTDGKTYTPIKDAIVTLTNSAGVAVGANVITDSNGNAVFDGVLDGNYYVSVTTPSSYSLVQNTQVITISNGVDLTVPFVASELGGVLVYAHDAVSGEELSGSVFGLSTLDGEYIGSYTVVNGGIAIPHLAEGYYSLVQSTAPNGYTLSSNPIIVKVETGETTLVDLRLYTSPFITVRVVVEGSSIAVEGALVDLVDYLGNTVATSVVDETGYCYFMDLAPGSYIVNFRQAPDGYTVKTGTATVNVTYQYAGTVHLSAVAHSSIYINNICSETGIGLDGAIFQIRDSSGEIIYSMLETGMDGVLVTPELVPGTYLVQELFAPAGYVPDTAMQTVQVKNNETCMATFTNSAKPSLVVYAYDTEYTPLVGVTYKVINSLTGFEFGSVTTNEDGMGVLDNVTPGIYRVSEVNVPNDYNVTETQFNVYMIADKATTLRFVHTPKSTIEIHTADMANGDILGFATYQILNLTGDLIGTFSTDASGVTTSGSLSAGTYLVKQTIAPDGYLLNTVTQTVNVTQDQTMLASFFNSKMAGLVIESVVQHSHDPLAGCHFEVYDDYGRLIYEGTTTSTGQLVTGILEPGKYMVKQMTTADGYSIPYAALSVTVYTDEFTTVLFENTALTNLRISLVEEISRKPIEGALFSVTSIGGDYVGEYETDESGYIIVPSLSTGTYMVHQMTAPSGYVYSTNYQNAHVTSGEDTELSFTNALVSGLTIQSVTVFDKLPISNTVYEVWDTQAKLVATVTTDSTGTATITDLAPGTYTVKEITTPNGYSILVTVQTVTVTTGDPSVLTFQHLEESRVTIDARSSKTYSSVYGVTYKITGANGDYVGHYTTNLSGLIVISSLPAGDYIMSQTNVPTSFILDTTAQSFTVRDEQPVYITDYIDQAGGITILNTCTQDNVPVSDTTFKITTVMGELVGNYTTSTDGKIAVTLDPGTYTVFQTYIDSSYEINNTIWNITVYENEQTTLEVLNKRLSSVKVQVVDETTGVGLYNVQLELRDPRNNMVGEYQTDNNGYIYITTTLADGYHEFYMRTAPSDYVMDYVPKTFYSENGGTVNIAWTLGKTQGQLTISTFAGDDSAGMNIRKGTALAGAQYEIYDATGKVITVVGGDSYGNAYSGALAVASYTMRQIVAPVGFQVNSSLVPFNVTKVNDDIKIEVYNKPINYDMTVFASGNPTVYANSTVKYYFTGISGSSTNSVNNFYMHINLPTDALRIEQLNTGTFNFTTAYSIEYKTNLSDYRTLVSNLNSSDMYSYYLNSDALGLSAGEYVTDVRYVFNQVPAGFAESMAPTMYCSILATVPTGYQVTVRTEVGGLIDGNWYSGANQYTSMGAGLFGASSSTIPNKLPTTGY